MDRRINILVVEDDRDIRALIELSLKLDDGIAVVTADSGFQAMRALRADTAFDVVLLDAGLPDVAGIDLVPQIMAAQARKPIVIFLTAAVYPREITQYLATGAVAVIAKPFEATALAAQILSHVRNARPDAVSAA